MCANDLRVSQTKIDKNESGGVIFSQSIVALKLNISFTKMFGVNWFSCIYTESYVLTIYKLVSL